MTPPLWSIRNLEQVITPDGYILIAYTDVPCHLYCRMTLEPPRIHKKPSYRRGLWIADDVRFCFTVFEDNEQTEAGDTTTHTFTKEPWPVCETRWFYFHGTINEDTSPSTTPFFEKHFKGVDMYVISLGKFTEEEILHGHVKLKQGAGIIITRDDVNNALEIASVAPATFIGLPDTPASYAGQASKLVAVNAGANALEFIHHQGFGNHWHYWDPDGEIAGSLGWDFDQVTFAVHDTGKQGAIYTRPMRSWALGRPHTCSFRFTRGPEAFGLPNAWMCAVKTSYDMYGNMSQPHIGFRRGTDAMLYATNGNGVNFTQTSTGISDAPPRALKWVRSLTDIKFYVDGVLKVTHDTNLPTDIFDAFFTFNVRGSAYGPRASYMTCPQMEIDTPSIGGYTEGARVYKDASTDVANATWAILSFNQERYDTDGIHDNAVNPTRLTCRTAGKYIISAIIRWTGNAIGQRRVTIFLNNTVDIGYQMIGTAGEASEIMNPTCLYDLAVDDYVEVRVYQVSGGLLSIMSTANYSPEFMMQRVG